MSEVKDNQFVFIDEEGNETLCEVIFTYECEENGKNYVFFNALDEKDENGNVVVGVASFKPKGEFFDELEPVEEEDEWTMLEEVFKSYVEECDGCEEEDCENCPHCE